MEAYLPDAGFEYARTFRYEAARIRRAQEQEQPHAPDERHAAASTAPQATDLCVLAVRSWKPNEVMVHCKAALKDLTRAEDEALHARAAEARNSESSTSHDFSVIRSSRRGCSQLLLGPARFINHDCNPNAEFRRSGHQLTIRCIRPVRRDEEITTYYGDNYFEWGNSECMCATCERRGRGFFAPKEEPATPAPAPAPAASDSRQTRSASRGQVPPARAQVEPMQPIEQARLVLGGQMLGPECTCLTCGAHFLAPEKWWTPDECPRCERHYKLFKADWPHRRVTEPGALRSLELRSKRRGGKPAPQREPSPTSLSLSPVKLSPIWAVNGEHHSEPEAGTSEADSDAAVRQPQARRERSSSEARRLKYEVRSDDSELEDFEHTHGHLGPRILGQQARTDVLAAYWGAPEGERRARRPASRSVTALTERASPAHAEPSRRRAPKVESPLPEPKAEAPPSPRRARAPAPSSPRRRAASPAPSSPKRRAASPAPSSPRRRAASPAPPSPKRLRAAPARHPHTERRDAAPPSEAAEDRAAKVQSQIATKGRERTSLSNLALFWSGGVEGRTRRQARQGAAADGEQKTPKREASEPARRASPAGKARAARERAPASASPSAGSAPVAGARTIKSEGTPPLAERGAAPPIGFRARDSPVPRFTPPLPATALSPPPDTNAPVVAGRIRHPARRNLRWGSGKTSVSRPLPNGAPPHGGGHTETGAGHGTMPAHGLIGHSALPVHGPPAHAPPPGHGSPLAQSAVLGAEPQRTSQTNGATRQG